MSEKTRGLTIAYVSGRSDPPDPDNTGQYSAPVQIPPLFFEHRISSYRRPVSVYKKERRGREEKSSSDKFT